MSSLIRLNRHERRPAGQPPEAPAIRALGVDPGLTRTGWALVVADGGRYRLVEAGLIEPRSSGGAGNLAGRLADGYLRFSAVLELTRPTLVVVEDVFTSPRFPKAALKMAHLRGVLCLAVAQAGIPLLELTATTVKQRLTGSGHASKEQVQRMVFELTDVSGVTAPSDVSDAIGLALAGLHQARASAFGRRARR